MRVRCLSLFAEYIDAIEAGTKTAEYRHFAMEPGPLALATNKKSGRAELRLLVDVTGADYEAGSDDGDGEEHDGIWYESSTSDGYANHLANVRPLRRDAVVEACYNCAAGRRDTHAGIFYVEAVLSAAPIKIAVPRSAPIGRAVEVDRRSQIIRPPEPIVLASPLVAPTVKVAQTALRPQDPFSIRRSLLADAIAEFGDTPEVRALFGKE